MQPTSLIARTMAARLTRSAGAKAASSVPSPSNCILPSPDTPPLENPYLKNPYLYPLTPSEKGVLTTPPYSTVLLPHWRFRTPAVAQTSSDTLWQLFLSYEEQNDFVGMDMVRKFCQMGMTRAKRYANYKGGRKYTKERGGEKVQLKKSEGHEGKEEKEEASRIFRGVWERCKNHEGYKVRKEEFVRGRKEWVKAQKEEG